MTPFDLVKTEDEDGIPIPALSEAVVAQWLQLVTDHHPDRQDAGVFVVANRLRESTYEDAVEWFARVHGTPGGDVAAGSVRPSTATYNQLIAHCKPGVHDSSKTQLTHRCMAHPHVIHTSSTRHSWCRLFCRPACAIAGHLAQSFPYPLYCQGPAAVWSAPLGHWNAVTVL